MSARRVPTGVLVLRTLQFSLTAGVALASLWGLLGGCREQSTVPIDRNHAPETFLTYAPGDSQITFYRVALHWSGSDEDGMVTKFDVAVTESLPKQDGIQWRRTQRTDSLITFRVEETREVLGHRFYVRSVDNEGKVDETPAFIFFGARDNVPPEVEFLRAIAFGPGGERKVLSSTNPDFPTDTIPTGWGVSFAWAGRDGDVAVGPDGQLIQVGRVDKYFYRLLPVQSEFLGGTIADTSAFYDADFFLHYPKGNAYAMQVRAIDDGGLSGSGSVTRSFVWNRDPVSRIHRCVRPGGVDSLACFTSADSTFYNGDTLALGKLSDPLPALELTATSYDPDPIGGDHTVPFMEWRSGTGAVFSSWTEMPRDGSPALLLNLRTADYLVMVRSIDRQERVEGSPDTLRFFVNLKPRFVTQFEDTTQTPLPDAAYRVSELQNGLLVRFLVTNPDGDPSEKIRYGLLWESPDERELFPRDVKELPPGRWYNVAGAKPRSGTFKPGAYKLTVIAEDNAQVGGESRGSRSNTRQIRIQVVAG